MTEEAASDSNADEASSTSAPSSRRSKRREAPEAPSGYRATRRGSRAARQARRAERQHRIMTSFDRTIRQIKNTGYVAGLTVGGLLLVLLVLWLGASGVNRFARWNAQRASQESAATSEQNERAKENLLIIADKDGEAAGFLAIRVDGRAKQAYGVAIPDGAFLEVPGRGFERVGDSYSAGPEVSLAAISNFFTVPFQRYAVVSEEAYQTALRSQSLAEIMSSASKTNLTATERQELVAALAELPSDNTALVPLQVKPISLGSQTYFEPQREELADLLESWWGVKLSDAEQVTRVIVYNGSGIPGIAGEAAQQLIRGGLRVVDTKNADRFDYAQTQIVVQNKDLRAGDSVRKVLGVGRVVNQPADQNVADVIVIIGKDYKPPKNAG